MISMTNDKCGIGRLSIFDMAFWYLLILRYCSMIHVVVVTPQCPLPYYF